MPFNETLLTLEAVTAPPEVVTVPPLLAVLVGVIWVNAPALGAAHFNPVGETELSATR